ncbi:MAG: radical SAM protein [Oscillospiraceae bacterium]|jgi:histone acetyltransferase (RNA polymerase elongator complex component)|nr:radical SAM protein [Oscillospiraceae bacterium]
MNRTNAAVFIPHLGCPHKCSFCDQGKITKAEKSVTSDDVSAILEKHVASLQKRGLKAEIAFFGGTFTALDPDYREELLSTANYYLKKHSGIFTGIRCSTRPDYIDEAVLEQLKKHGVTAVELGAQSMDDEVLKLNNRGHDSDDVRKSAVLVKRFGFESGLQMMTGLYGDTAGKSLYTADELIALKPDTVRIYPTVILKDTMLGDMYESGEYQTFSLEETIELCAEIYGRFTENNIRVIRLGLNISSDTTPIGELCIGRYYFKKMLEFMQNSEAKKFRVYTDRKNISKINGHRCENKIKLQQLGFTYKIKEKQGGNLLIEPV